MVRQIGLDVPIPEGECQDKKCPFHSNLSVRGQVIEGEVISTSMIGSATVVRYGKRISGKFDFISNIDLHATWHMDVIL